MESKVFNVDQQPQNIENDEEDLQILKGEIDKVEKMKTEFQTQKQEINRLNNMLANLKSENKNLKGQTNLKSMRKNTEAMNTAQNTYEHSKRSNKDQITGTIAPRKMLSPQIERASYMHASMNSPQKRFVIQQSFLEPNGVNDSTKKNVISNFVDELREDLRCNEKLLKKERSAHNETKIKFQELQRDLNELRLRFNDDDSYNSILSENEELKLKLTSEINHRLHLEGVLAEKQGLIEYYQQLMGHNSEDYEMQLNRMDRIYHAIENELTY